MKKPKPTPRSENTTASPSLLIDARIKELGGWRGETLACVRNDGDLYWLQFHLTAPCANIGGRIRH